MTKIYVFMGPGGGKRLHKYLKDEGIAVKCFYDQNWINLGEINGNEVKAIEDANPQADFVIVSILSGHEAVIYKMMHLGFEVDNISFIVPDEYLVSEAFETEDTYYKGTKIGRYTYGYKTLIDSAAGNNFLKSIGRYTVSTHLV